MTVDVIIPVYRPGEELKELLGRLKTQTLRPSRILLVNTEREFFDESLLEGMDDVELIHVHKYEFDHGGTRHMAAMKMDGDLLLFMTQDAIPANPYLIRELVRPFQNERVAASYARQLPNKNCHPLESYTRSFNYPENSRIKSSEDIAELGIKTYFCSNVCAMYRRSIYHRMGGFERRTIFNEDMIFAGRLIQKGFSVAYCAQAQVIHSHNYTGLQQFHRNFDLGVSQAEHPEIFRNLPSEKEGIRMIRQTVKWLVKSRQKKLIPKLIWQSGCKFAGYRLGKMYRILPLWLVRACSMNPGYFRQNQSL